MTPEMKVAMLGALASKYGLRVGKIEAGRKLCDICRLSNCGGREDHNLMPRENQIKENGK